MTSLSLPSSTGATSTVQPFYDGATGTVSYVVWDHATRQAAVIDPVLDYDPDAGRTHGASARRLLDYLQAERLVVEWILETHAHADHLSAARHIQAAKGGKVAIGAAIRTVQRTFGPLFGMEPSAQDDSFDHLFEDGEVFRIGATRAEAIGVPGHTPADMAYRIDGAVFVGDTLFLPDVGTARADFPGGDAAALYRSIQRLLALPGDTRMFVCHDYPPAGRAPACETTVEAQRRSNIHVGRQAGERAFVALRQARDATLAVPRLLLPSIQVNVRGGRLPDPGPEGIAYLRIPLNVFGSADALSGATPAS
ncbi:MBL fold metallo-hydrolase [Paracidovorax citrulli]|uniref:Beta-lactamase domain protein n=2 Tax=Paracidovorax citrulli TaxID=80869 RepID=A1TWB5_PARC0|nr:MBL fold metallo-hydrolase [Paracidovorax citrulli]ABM35253.1 beta-lactamase domain protein [Paracidovorax citrulli AAC00-1]ATG97092.1 MBL fold metallo-hydrolase [Paracidovorax citrulli]PVY64709.1 glyoxylase-like metal-dependent hydrolase (beta-lactamase superfamily II) [Paracidovorax citrulli]QCX10612.1 putative metallo-hydrolase [Paracidovorax citrulli]REG71093.1 glyoxylase-like metal-dependent hydrolase (beta-lactamase superfamily II) [Paracidovorax citrulli]